MERFLLLLTLDEQKLKTMHTRFTLKHYSSPLILRASTLLRYLKVKRDSSRPNVNHICKIIYLSLSQSTPVRHSVEIVVRTDSETRNLNHSLSHLHCLPPPFSFLAVTPGAAEVPVVQIAPSII